MMEQQPPVDQVADFVVGFIMLALVTIGLISMLVGWITRKLDERAAVKSVNTFRQTAPAITSSTAADETDEQRTDETDEAASVDPLTCPHLQLDRTRGHLIDVLLYNGWKVEEIRKQLKGENAAISAEIAAARGRLGLTSAQPPAESKSREYICADCLHEQDAMSRPCDYCNSTRVVVRSVAQMVKRGEAQQQPA